MKNYLPLIFALVTLSASAQEVPSVQKNLFKINLLAPGVVYEHGFTEKITLYSELSVGFVYRESSFVEASSAFLPVLIEQLRYYNNFDRRLAKGKNTTRNSGNYVALLAVNQFKPFAGKNLDNFNFRNNVAVGSVYGLQRTYRGNFNIDLNFGLAYNFSKDNSIEPFQPVVNFSLGWVIGK